MAKDILSPNQLAITQRKIDAKDSHVLCWICGDEESLYKATVDLEGKTIQTIFCSECVDIQKDFFWIKDYCFGQDRLTLLSKFYL